MAWVAVIAMLFWVSRIYVAQFDWTYLQRSTLSPSSQDVLASLEGPVEIRAFVHDTDVVGRRMIEVLIGRYQRYKEDIRLQIVNPDREPELVRELGISAPREMLVTYAGSSERLSQTTEDDLSHLLLRLARRGEQSIYFLTGHGERSITGVANFDLGDFGKALEGKGFRLQTLNLVSASTLPPTEGPWVLASPSASLQPHELELLSEFLARGGNLLWVLDPNAAAGRPLLAEKLGVTVLDGTVVDAGSRLYGIDDPAFAVISEYPEHEITDWTRWPCSREPPVSRWRRPRAGR